MLKELEDPNESFSAVAKRHNASASTLYATAKRYRPDLIAQRKESGVHKQIARTVEVTDEQREAAVQSVLSGRSVKDVAADTGIPAPTLYKWANKARTQLTHLEVAVLNTQYAGKPAANAVLDVLTAQLQASAAQLNTTTEQLLQTLAVRLRANA